MSLGEDAAPEVDESTDEPTDAEAPTPGDPSTGRLAWVLVAILGVVAAGAVAVAVLDPFARTPPAAAEEVVREASSLLLELDSSDAEQIRPQLEALAAGTFREEVDRAFGAGLSDVLAAAETDAAAEVTRVFLDESATGSVSAISVSEVTRSGPELPEATTFDVYLQLELLRVDGAWRVVEVTDLGLGGGSRPRAPVPSGTPTPGRTPAPDGTSGPTSGPGQATPSG